MLGHHESCVCGECSPLPLFAPKFVHGNEPSREAAQSMVRPATRLRAEVLQFIRNEGTRGATDEEIVLGLGINPSTARPRRIELVEQGLVADTGQFRPGRSGRAMTVWRAVTA